MSPTARFVLVAVALIGLLTHLTGSFYIALGIAALVPAGRYGWSIKTHPFATCRRCNGTASHRDPIFFWARRECYWCLGLPGKKVRLGARLLTTFGKREHAAAMARRQVARSKIKEVRW